MVIHSKTVAYGYFSEEIKVNEIKIRANKMQITLQPEILLLNSEIVEH